MTENEHSLRSGASYVRTCTTRGCNGESGGNTLAQNPPQLRRVCLRPIERNTPPTRAFCTPLSCADETGATSRRPKKRDIVAATCTLHSTTCSQTYTGYPDWGVAKGAGRWEATGMDNLICPRCGGRDHLYRNGHNRSGTQGYRCGTCRRVFTPAPKEQGYGETTQAQAVRLYLEGMSLRAVGRILGVVHQSVANWVAAAAADLPASVGDASPTETVEVDELFTFVEQKKRGCSW